MPTINKIKRNGTVYDLPAGGGGGSSVTYTIEINGHTLTLTGSDGSTDSVALPDDSYDDTTIAGRVTAIENWKDGITDGESVKY